MGQASINYLRHRRKHPAPSSLPLYLCVGKVLEDRANAGDVQTCVALCEILQVLQINSDAVSTCIPGLQVKFVREWY
jgi:hypothetical protein